MTIASVAACKFTRFVLRKTGRGGTAVPGIVAMKISKNILAAVSDGMKIVVVTGTNGKTTSCNMIEHALTASGCNCLLNKSGANLLHGIAADLISNATWLGKPKYDYAVLECDEAALKQLVPFVNPKAIVVTNLFSDQVDRYGGVQNTLKEIRTGVERSPKSTLVLNAEEPLSASLALNVPNKVVWYGLDASVGVQGNIDLSDAGKCPKCGGDYEYDYHVYAHLGGFRCSKCGHTRQTPDVSVTSIDKIAADGSTIQLKTEGKTQTVHVALPAVYNVYNAAGAVAAVKAMGLPLQKAIDSLASVRSSFGRLETFDLNGNRLQMILVKNPAGCNQAFSYVTGFDEDFSAILCLNDRTGDGHDISWINDTDYEKLCTCPHLKKLYVAGDRAADLSERLRKAGAGDDLQTVVTDYNKLLEYLKQEKYPIFAMPNYTSMMELRAVLNQVSGNKDFWE
ncbi:MAG: DUF1727 domain-containing protein [Clostridiales bacterium]|nr:DUF1727 domain-containing protein [Candidatus Blautia equi]